MTNNSHFATAARIPKLDFLRAFSASTVVAFHWGVNHVPAGFGVTTFFVISGFLITYLLMQESQRTGTVSLKEFYIRRSLRIFPAFYAYWILAVCALVVTHNHINWYQAAASFFYVGNYYQGLHGYPTSLFSHTWSISVEEQFYCLWPAVFFVFGRGGANRLLKALLLIIPLLWLYRAALHFHGIDEAYIYTAFETRIDALLVGCSLGIMVSTRAFHKLLETLRRPLYVAPTLVLLTLSVAAGDHYGVAYRNVIGFAIDPVLIAILILQLTTMSAANWMDSAPLAYLGKISYSTYLYQQLVLPMIKPRVPESLSLVCCFLGVWVVAALSYELIERPFLRLRRRFGSLSATSLRPVQA
jgi:peptidoglycan/LPS O-acetylase OafA/YrhL